MLATLIIVFREILEAGLIVGIVLATTRGVNNRVKWVSFGIIGGLIGASIIAAFASKIADAFAGVGQEIFNASILLFAVAMLAWHNVWMAKHGKQMAAEMRQLGQDVVNGKKSLMALATIVGVAILREGAEVVLFLHGVSASGDTNTQSMLLGGLLGIVSGVTISGLMYFSLLKIPTKYLFKVTGAMITLLAAGLAAKAMVFLQQAGIIESFYNTVWDSSAILSESSFLGKVLNILIGYVEQPNQLQVIAYIGTLVVIIGFMQITNPQKKL